MVLFGTGLWLQYLTMLNACLMRIYRIGHWNPHQPTSRGVFLDTPQVTMASKLAKLQSPQNNGALSMMIRNDNKHKMCPLHINELL